MLTTEHTDVAAVTDLTQAGAGVAGVLNGAKLIFGTNNITPSKTGTPAAITEPTDADLAPVTITWGAAARDSNGDIVTLSQLIDVHLANISGACTIKSLGITDSTGTYLLASEDLGLGYQLVDTLSYWGLQVPWAPGNPQGKTSIWTS
jgi:hypothetical protein